ncbi:hypothetical protein SHKM778_05280 [Streptomyces sp. KM77-8]|uniref:Uncharacterized protein n=1 Tax=Streptomyces haneummycinicus TaxID=3074435 RepID=A0AAT9HA04_9ACTN
MDAVRLVKADPAVSPEVKRALQPCVADEYPVDVSYGDLTRGAVDDLVVNVLTCGDMVGVGTYVYREQGGAYVNVFSAEEPRCTGRSTAAIWWCPSRCTTVATGCRARPART